MGPAKGGPRNPGRRSIARSDAAQAEAGDEVRISRERPTETWSDVYAVRTAPGKGNASFDFVFVADTGMIGARTG